MIGIHTTIIVIVVCALCEAFFSGSEMAVVSADRTILRRKAGEGDRAAKLAVEFLSHPQRLLATTLIGTNTSVVIATTVMTLAMLQRDARHGELLAVAILSPALLVCGEIVPKTLFQQNADRWVTKIVYPLRVASIVLTPLVYLLGKFTTRVARALDVEEKQALVTRDELRILLETPEGGQAGASSTEIPEGERAMISNVLDFGERTVYDVMVPLSEVTALPEDASIDESSAEIAEKQHTRIPIYRERVDQIVGVLHAFDIIKAEAQGKKGTIAELGRPPIYIPESKPTVDLLVELQRAGQQLAVVVDEYGGATGICTIEDILEEIVGEIDDEYDRGPSPIRPEGPNVWRVLARTSIHQVNEALKIDLPEGEDYETLAGMILDKMKRIPREGESLRVGQATISIVGASERAIEEVRIRVNKRR
jgi:CBS domain containing-hemolysin-like protein